MSDYSAFFLMKPEDVKRYAVDVLHFFQPDEETDCVEIGDGNINYVFQVRSRKDGRSVIVKQADKLLRSSGRPLDLYRNKIEAETLMLEARLLNSFRRSIITMRPWPPSLWRTFPPTKISARSWRRAGSTAISAKISPIFWPSPCCPPRIW